MLAQQTRMLYTVTRSVAEVLRNLSGASRVASRDVEFFLGLDETLYRNRGVIVVDWGEGDDWADVVVQGPNFHIANTFYKSPNQSMNCTIRTSFRWI